MHFRIHGQKISDFKKLNSGAMHLDYSFVYNIYQLKFLQEHSMADLDGEGSISTGIHIQEAGSWAMQGVRSLFTKPSEG